MNYKDKLRKRSLEELCRMIAEQEGMIAIAKRDLDTMNEVKDELKGKSDGNIPL